MTENLNLLKAWTKQKPEWIPVRFWIPWLDWKAQGYDEAEIEAVCMKHPILFPGYTKGTLKKNFENVPNVFPDQIAGQPYTDYWGSVWETTVTGMVGTVKQHPLDSWDNFENFHAPDPDISDGVRKIDWDHLAKVAASPDRSERFMMCGLTHGHTFLRAQDLRGYMNLLGDMADEDPRLDQLLDMICDFNVALIQRFLKYKPNAISIPEDLGMQTCPLMTVEQFHKYIAPRYERITRPIKEAGIIVHEHSDGYIMDLIDDLVKFGGNIINLQDLVNGIDNIQKNVKGRMVIDLDIDRQNITVFGSPKDIDDHIRECVMKLAAPEGGLSMIYSPWPPTSAVNMDAVFTAMEKYCITEYMYR